MLIFEHLFLLMPPYMMQLYWLLVYEATRESHTNHHTAYLKILHLLDQTNVFLYPQSSLFSIYLQPIIMLTSLLGDCDVCNHTNRCPTTQEFIDRPELPTVHLCALEALPERTPFLRYNCHGQQWHDSQGTRSIILFRRLEGWQFRPRLRLPATPKHRSTAQDSKRTLPSGMSETVAPFCRTALWLPFCDRHQPRVNWVPSWCGPLLLLGR